MSFSFKNNLRIFLILIFLLFLYVIICATSYTNAVCSNISENIFRLHVIANSNSTDDQNLKYIVRDSVLSYINTTTKESTSKEEIINIVNNNLSQIEEIAQNTIYNNGYNYDVELSVGTFPFPTKTYGSISLPSGFYDALQIEIGEAKGENWWCVMFPPLCFIDVSSGIVPEESKEIMKENLSTEEYSLISSTNNESKIKFKIVEVLQNLSINGIFM